VNWAFLTGNGTLATGGEDATIRLWRAGAGQEVRVLPLSSPAYSAALASDGRTLITAHGRVVRLWDVPDGKFLHKLSAPDGIKLLTLSGGLLAISTQGRLGRLQTPVTLWDIGSGALRWKLDFSSNGLYALALSPDGNYLATGGGDRRVGLWDVRTRKQLWERPLIGQGLCQALAFAPDGKTLAAGQPQQGKVLLYDVASGKEVGSLDTEQRTNCPLAYSPDGRLLAVAGWEKITLYDVASRDAVLTLDGHRRKINHLAFGPDSRTLITASDDTTALVWDLAASKEVARSTKQFAQLWTDLAGHAKTGFRAVTVLAASPDALPWLRERLKAEKERLDSLRIRRVVQALEWMAGAEAEGLLKSLNHQGARAALERLAGKRRGTSPLRVTPIGQTPRVLQEHNGRVAALAFSPDRRTLAMLWDNGHLRVVDVTTNDVLLEQDAHEDGAFTLAFSPDGKTLATGGADRRIQLWDLATRKELRSFTGPTRKVATVAFSPNGKMLAAGGPDGKVYLFDLPGGNSRSFALGREITSLSFTPDGSRLAVASMEKPEESPWPLPAPVVLLDVRSGKQRGDLGARGSAVAFAPSGNLALTCGSLPIGDDGRQRFRASQQFIMLCRPGLGEALRIPAGGTAVALSGCGRLFAGGSDRVQVWEAGSGKEVLRLADRSMWTTALALSPDGRMLAAGTGWGDVLVWDLISASRDPRLVKQPDRNLAACWKELAADPPTAFRVQGELVLAGDRSVLLLGEKLQPAREQDIRGVERLIADLDSDDFAKRESASAKLKKLGDSVEAALRRALEGKPGLEQRRRIERLLLPLLEPGLPAERLRLRRALAVLEQIGSPEAVKVLRRLAAGAADAALTREAKAALSR
jgi:WD40 repeat protein